MKFAAGEYSDRLLVLEGKKDGILRSLCYLRMTNLSQMGKHLVLFVLQNKHCLLLTNVLIYCHVRHEVYENQRWKKPQAKRPDARCIESGM